MAKNDHKKNIKRCLFVFYCLTSNDAIQNFYAAVISDFLARLLNIYY